MLELPILAHRSEIVNAVRSRNNNVVIVVGETGSGKTTQLPQILRKAGIGEGGIIGITEPRRIAVTSVARFVADELKTKLGDIVGYKIRFDDRAADNTAIKFMTSGILLREIQGDPDLCKYSVIMIDEAHERDSNIDFLLGLLKDLLNRRDDLKVVISSATINAEKFSRYFCGAPVIKVSGRTYPVEIVWGDQDVTEMKMVDAVVDKIIDIHENKPDGDILVFMTGVQDINEVIKKIREYGIDDLIALPAHASLSPEDQGKIFQSFYGKRKVIVATNIAETSITIDGVVYVVDSGLIKQTHFHPETGIQSLDVVYHSKAGCDQRMGRAGRTCPGVCYRMFTEMSFEDRLDFTEPEIRRMSLAGVVLLMESIGIEEVEEFDFIDSPDKVTFHEAYEMLIVLGAIIRGKKGLTKIGKAMVLLPLEPRIARMVIEAIINGCVENVAIVAAFLSVRPVFVRPRDKKYKADAAHMKFKDRRSDALTFLKVWKACKKSGFNRDWCFKNFINFRFLLEVKNVFEQLLSILIQNNVEITQSDDEKVVMKSVVAGLIYNLFEHSYRGAYADRIRGIDDVWIHPGSSVFSISDNPRWIVASEIVKTSRSYARNVTRVDVEWLPEFAPDNFMFGKTQLVSYSQGDEDVLVRTPIFSRPMFDGDIPIGFGEDRISVSEARIIQKNSVDEAQANNWIPLVFSRGGRLFALEAVSGGVTYQCKILSEILPEEGVIYYCKTKQSLYGDGMEADPQFLLLHLCGEERMVESVVSQLGVIQAVSRYEVKRLGSVVVVPVENVKAEAFVVVKARRFQCVECSEVVQVSRKQFALYNNTQGAGLSLKCGGCGTEATCCVKLN